MKEFDLVKAVTDDFVDSFKDDADLSGPFFRICLGGQLPLCVDANDPRVREILERARKQMAATVPDDKQDAERFDGRDPNDQSWR